MIRAYINRLLDEYWGFVKRRVWAYARVIPAEGLAWTIFFDILMDNLRVWQRWYREHITAHTQMYMYVYGHTTYRLNFQHDDTSHIHHICIYIYILDPRPNSHWIVFSGRMYRDDRFALVNDIQMAAVDMRNWKSREAHTRSSTRWISALRTLKRQHHHLSKLNGLRLIYKTIFRKIA